MKKLTLEAEAPDLQSLNLTIDEAVRRIKGSLNHGGGELGRFGFKVEGEDEPEYREFSVAWCIDISARTPRKAAEEALKIMREPGSGAVTFEIVAEDGETITINLDDDEPCDACDGMGFIMSNRDEACAIMEIQKCDQCGQYGDDNAATAAAYELAKQAFREQAK